MKKLKIINILKWLTGLGFLVFIVIEKLNFLEGYPTIESEIFDTLNKIMLLSFLVITFYESRILIKQKDQRIEELEAKLKQSL
ncbi:hypothetical protein [Hanstruepera flava]|uniref:hypothetical protein n=1 Tax=Hanstruepera flava TaxID=2930218 RepID=UPI0020283312|nr:hypothetical protein [Hanstruepera flava]